MTPARKLTIEFIGTFFLVFTVGMAVARAGTLAPLAIGSVLMVMVFAGGHISGGHYNPAVSTAVFSRGKLAVGEYVPYVVTQAVAAVLAGLLVKGLGYVPHSAAAVAGTGKMLIVGAFAVGSISGGAFNPAVALGASVLGLFTCSHYWIYLLAELAAGVVAAGVFQWRDAIAALAG